MKILLLGCNGQIGKCLNHQLKNTNHEVIYANRNQIDIADFEVTKKEILEISPDIIINSAAYTAVDKAEKDQNTADLINHLAVVNIANVCNLQGIWLIHFSTDYVFDGNSEVPYKEENKKNPQNIYGKTKLKGELAIQSSGCKHIIIRTAWVFSEYGNNFLKTMVSQAIDHNELSIISDQIGCPTYAQDIAKAVISIINQLNSSEDLEGIYHFSGNYACSWFEFAKEIFNELCKYEKISIPDLKKVLTDEYPTVAKRPKFSVLDNSKLQEKFDILPSDWKVGIKSAVKKIITG